jgi:hypothetical protein
MKRQNKTEWVSSSGRVLLEFVKKDEFYCPLANVKATDLKELREAVIDAITYNENLDTTSTETTAA